MRPLLWINAWLFFVPVIAQGQTSAFLDSLLRANMPNFAQVFANQEKFKLQIIYTQINRDKKNKPSFIDHNLNTSDKYIYPASTIKLPISMLALIKLDELGIKRSFAMVTDSAFFCQKKISKDSTSESGYPTIENYIKKMFLVSDNSACARVYEFVGHDYAHQKLKALGYKNIRLFNRLDGQCPGDTSKITPPVYFIDANKDTVLKQPLTFASETLKHPVADSKIGKMKIGKNQFVSKDFSRHNYLSPTDLHSIMKKLVFNEYLGKKEKLFISNENRTFMLKYLAFYPKESEHPKYDKKTFYDSYKKYFLYGSSIATIKQDSIRVFNIVGRAYGFLIDCAYIVDFKNKIEYLLTACIYVNEKNTIGSGKYEYDKIGLPFLKELSWSLYHFEKKRVKDFEADLTEFKEILR